MSNNIDPIKNFWNFFKSVKFTVFILALLILSCIIGTLVAQKPQINIPVEEIYSPLVFKILDFFNLFDLYHSWWFTLLLGMFFVNLLICVADKVPQYLKQFKADLSGTSLEILKKSQHYSEITVLNFDKLNNVLKEKLPKFKLLNKSDDFDRFFYERGKASIFNPLIIHLGILLIMIGAIWISVFGFEGQVVLRKNQTTSTFNVRSKGNSIIIPLGFALKCNDFKIDYYTEKKIRPKQYYSDLEIIKHNSTIKKETIYVNKPLFYGGFNIYQSSYGSDPSFSFVITNKETKKEHTLTAALNEKTFIGETKNALIPVSYSKDFIIDKHSSLGPAVLVHFITEKKMHPPFWLLLNYPYIKTQPQSVFDIALKDLNEELYTVLSVSKTPGVLVIWLGSFLLLLGLFLLCFYKHDRFYIVLEKSSSTTHIIAKTNKLPLNLEKYFNKIINTCKDI